MQVNRPKEYRPELANKEAPLSREDKLRSELGLTGEDEGIDSESEEEKPTLQTKRYVSP